LRAAIEQENIERRLERVHRPAILYPEHRCEYPTAGEIAAARGLIVDDLLGEFPFTSPAERAHAVALLLLGFLRAMIDGPTPLHLIEKPAPGTGAATSTTMARACRASSRPNSVASTPRAVRSNSFTPRSVSSRRRLLLRAG
jgi:hypothetical protein